MDRQTDRRTDGIGVAYTRYSIYAVARKKKGISERTVRGWINNLDITINLDQN